MYYLIRPVFYFTKATGWHIAPSPEVSMTATPSRLWSLWCVLPCQHYLWYGCYNSTG